MVDIEKILATRYPERSAVFDERDCMLYALGTGFAQDPTDEAELAFTYERNLKVSPSAVTVVCMGTDWVSPTGVDFTGVVHGEQRLHFQRPVRAGDRVLYSTRVVEAVDKGPGKGLILSAETEVRDASTGAVICTAVTSAFCRNDGGAGGSPVSRFAIHAMPDRAPDRSIARPTQANQALFYRLCGDRNPLHAEPAFARKAGFPRPILHGLCTYGFACRAVLEAYCDYDPARLAAFDVRFSAPVFPGETIVTDLWRDGDVVSFRCRAAERNTVILNNGRAAVRAS
jgi:acyl dehydratase